MGDDIFAPEWTDYDQRIHYRTYDVTAHLAQGTNVIGVVLGDGWWSGYVGWQETRARYDSLENSLIPANSESRGSRNEAGSSCQTLHFQHRQFYLAARTGPILFSDFMMGKKRTTPAASAGAGSPSRASNDTRGWLPAKEVPAPLSPQSSALIPLVSQPAEPVRIKETLAPACPMNEITPGACFFRPMART